MSRSRSFLPLFIVILLVFSGSCRREEPPLPAPAEEQSAARLAGETAEPEVRNPCGKGDGVADPFRPIVCVDDTGSAFIVNPDPVRAHDRRGKDDPGPVVIHWFTHTGQGDLRLEFHRSESGDDCVEKQQCNSPGHCMARVIGQPKGGREIKCKYDVWMENSTIPRLDPEAIIVPCC
jgi:hypothetical protein